jgi:hypothetical protein
MERQTIETKAPQKAQIESRNSLIADFINTIGHKQKSANPSAMSAVHLKADLSGSKP